MTRMAVRSLFAIPALLAALAPCAAAQARDEEPVRLRPGDVVRIEVRDEPSLGGQFQVGEDGLVLIPVIGLVPVAGRPFDEVRDDVRRAYTTQLSDPVLRITPLTRVAVLGEVMRPGVFHIEPTQTLADLLAMVGGLTPFADRGKVMLLRDGATIRVRIDPEDASLSRRLRSGDRIMVGRRGWLSEHLAIFVSAAASVAAAAATSLIIR